MIFDHHAVGNRVRRQGIHPRRVGYALYHQPAIGVVSTGAGNHYLIAVNDSDQPRDLQLSLDRNALEGCTTFTGVIGSSEVLHATGPQLALTVPAKQAAIFEAQ